MRKYANFTWQCGDGVILSWKIKTKMKNKKVLDKWLDVCYDVGNVKRKSKFNFRTEIENENRNRISV